MRITRLASNQLLLSTMFVVLSLVVCQAFVAQVVPSGNDPKVASSSSAIMIDPDVVDSEWNHHLAGYILIASAVLMLLSLRFTSVAFLRPVWPFLFVAAGIYLLAWSDKEIWPRGFLSWSWLIHHDAEARQHKIYGVLLLIIGAVEYLRWRGKLSRWWKTWAFSILAVIGACLLLVHDHGGNSGLPPGWDSVQKAARIAQMARASGQNLVAVSLTTTRPSKQVMDMPEEHHDMAHMMSPPTDREGKVSVEMNAAPHPNAHAGHVMTPSMLHVTAQHMWFTLVGLAIALFKFVHDAGFWRKRFVPYLWPSGMLILGTLLTLYTETV